MRSTKVIKEEIGKIEKMIEHLRADKAKAVGDFEEQQATREKLSLPALTSGGKAAFDLEEARLRQRHAELEIEDVNTAIAQAHKRLEALRAELDSATEEAKQQEYERDAAALIADCDVYEKALVALVSAKSAFRARLAKMSREAPEHMRRHNNILNRVRQAAEQRFTPQFLLKDQKEFYAQSISEICRRILSGEMVEEVQQKTGS